MKKKLVCPDCNTVMVKTYHECSDESGWIGGWSCDCQPSKEQQEIANKIGDK